MAIHKIFLTHFRTKRAGMCKGRGTVFMNNYIILLLARFFGALTLIPILAQSFLRAQGLGSAESGIVLLYSEHFGLSRIRSDREKESPKSKTNPKQSHFFRPQSSIQAK